MMNHWDMTQIIIVNIQWIVNTRYKLSLLIHNTNYHRWYTLNCKYTIQIVIVITRQIVYTQYKLSSSIYDESLKKYHWYMIQNIFVHTQWINKKRRRKPKKWLQHVQIIKDQYVSWQDHDKWDGYRIQSDITFHIPTASVKTTIGIGEQLMRRKITLVQKKRKPTSSIKLASSI